jgi:hypothetical protein
MSIGMIKMGIATITATTTKSALTMTILLESCWGHLLQALPDV